MYKHQLHFKARVVFSTTARALENVFNEWDAIESCLVTKNIHLIDVRKLPAGSTSNVKPLMNSLTK